MGGAHMSHQPENKSGKQLQNITIVSSRYGNGNGKVNFLSAGSPVYQQLAALLACQCVILAAAPRQIAQCLASHLKVLQVDRPEVCL